MALETSLTHSWTLNGNSNDNKGTANGSDTSMTYVTGRKNNQCGNFSGAGYVTIADTGFPSGTTAVSFSAWIKTSYTADYQIFFSYGTNTSTNTVQGGLTDAGVLYASQQGQSVTDGDINNGNWHHVVITRNASSNYTVYTDGVSSNSGVMTTNTTLSTCRIGSDTANAFKWNGTVQDVAFWAKEVSSAEVTSLWNSGNGMYFDGSVFQNYAGEATIDDDYAYLM